MPTRFGVAAMGMGSTRTWLVNADCEETGTPTGWTNTTGTPNWDYTTVPLAGAQSLYLSLNGAAHRARIDFTNQSEVFFYSMFRFTNGTAPSANTTVIAFNVNGGASPVNLLTITTANKFRIGTAGTAIADSFVIDTTYHLWWHYRAGISVDTVYDIGFSTDGVRPTSGTKFVSQSSPSGDSNLAGRLFVGTTQTTMGMDLIIDTIRVAATQINDSGA